MENARHKAVFIDRDGTLNVEKDYLYKISDFEFVPHGPQAVRLLNENGFKVIVISNQSGIARGYFKTDDVQKLHDHIGKELEKEKARIDAFFYCPHHPDGTVAEFRRTCECRKPAPGMVLEAAARFDLDLSQCFVVGDHLSDMLLKKSVPVTTVLVKTGHGERTLSQLQEIKPDYIEEDLLRAVERILYQSNLQ